MRFGKTGLRRLAGIFTCTLAGLLFICNFSSCEVGLGGAVDTQPPTVSISYPPSLSIIKDSFIFAGTWTDDIGVTNVHVDVYHNKDNGKQLVHSEEAVVNTDGNWSLELNKFDSQNAQYYNGWQFCDGDYEIQVYAEDKAKHTSGISSRTFSIDNTAPVLVITNPTSAGSDLSPAAFGQIVQLTGSFYDFCGKLSSLTVSFYDEDGKAICDSDFYNITSMSDASPLVIARYFADPAQQQKNQKIFDNYCALLGSTKVEAYQNGTSFDDTKIYFTVTASDDAKEFKTVGDNGTGSGNLTQKYYRGTTSMQNLVSGDGGIENFSLVDFASYLNKTTNEYASHAQTINDISNAAQSFSTTVENTDDIGTDITNDDSSMGAAVYLTYTVNPMNNPFYTVGGYEVVASDVAAANTESYSANGYKKVYNGAPIPVSVSVGKDQKNISTHTVTVYLVDTTKYTGTIDKSMFTGNVGKTNYEAGYYDILCTWDADVKNEFADWGKSLSSDKYIQTSEDANVSSISKQLTVTFPTAGNDYLFYVVGKDITGNDLVSVNSAGYGFCGTTATTAATITFKDGNGLNDVVNLHEFKGEPTPPATSVTSLDNVLYLAGEITTEERLAGLTYTLTVTDASDSTKTHTKNGTINIAVRTTAPNYSNDFTSSYCYTLNESVAQKKYFWRWTAASGASDFASTITSEGSYDVTFVLSANNGATSTFQRTFTIDNKNPDTELSDVTPSANRSGGGYWINPESTIKISGLVSDNLSTSKACKTWIELIAFKAVENETDHSITYSEVSTAKYTSARKTGDSKWEISVTKDQLPAKETSTKYYSGVNLYIYSEDKAGNIGVSATPVKLFFDTTPPKALHAEDGNGNDVFFRVGEADNDDITEKDNPTIWKKALDIDVGGKYSGNTFGNASTIRVRGNFKDEDSGLSMIYYKIYSAEPSEDDINEFFGSYTTTNDGYFAPLEADEERRVFYTGLAENEVVPAKKGVIGLINDDAKPEGAQTKVTSEGNVTNKKGEFKYWAKIKNNFNTTISGLSVGKNYIAFVAVDKVGNAAKDAVTIKGEGDLLDTYNNIILNVDNESPILVCSQTGQQYTNGVNPISLSGTYSDLPSSESAGVKSITITISGEDTDDLEAIEATLHEDLTWEATIPAATVASLTQGKTYNVNGTIKDNAGNSSSATLFPLSFDKVAPTVTVKTPANNSTVNGKITITGSVNSEGSIPVKLELYVSKNKPVDGDVITNTTKFTKIDTITESSKIYSWSIDASKLNTYTITGVTGTKPTSELYVIPVVTDGAGNSNVYDLATSKYVYTLADTTTLKTNCFEYTVDMNSDRPTVKFTNLTNVATTGQTPVYILKFGDQSKLEGNVSDDDSNSTSVVDTFIVSATQLTAAPTDGSDGWTRTQSGNEITWTKTGEGSTKFNTVTGDYTYTPSNTADGQKKVYFLVKDNGGQVFYTGHTTGPYQPYQQYKAEIATKTSNTTYLEYKSDGTSPTISDVKLVLQYRWQDVKTKQNATTIYFTDSACTTNASESTADTATVYRPVEPGTSTVVGGANESKVIFLVKATDANGIKEMNLKYTSYQGTEQTINSSSGTFTATTTAAEAVWITEEISVADFKTGSVNVAVTAYDQSDLFANQNPVFMVDNDGPSINISSPSSSDEVSGAVSIAGQATDSGGAGEPTIHFLIPTSAQKSDQAGSGKSDLEYYKTLAVGAGNWIGNLKAEKTPAAFEFVFNGDVNDNASLDIYTKSDTSNTYGLTPDGEGIYLVPIYFRSQDSLGNINVIKFTAKYNPDADKPRTEISYPSAANYQGSNDYVTLGGTIRVTGSVTIPSLSTTPERVYIQIASQNGDWGTADKTNAGTGDGNYGYTVKTITNVQSDIGKTVTGFTSTALSDAWWGIEAVRSSNAWSFILNENGKLNPYSGVNAIKIRACAVNAEGKMGAWSEPVSIHIDASAPEYTTKLYQFSADTPAVGAQTAEKEYEPGMFLKGQWYIGIHLTDDDGIHDSDIANDTKKIKVQRNGENVAASDITKIWEDDDDESDDYHKVLDLYIKLSDKLSSQSYKVDVCDTADPEHWVYPTYEINVDNKAPELGTIKTGEGYPLSMTKQRTSNKVITFGTTAKDEGSGFSRLAFYFKRGSSIELPLPAVENANQKKWKVGTAYAEDLTVIKDNLYGVTLTGAKGISDSGTNTTFTSSGIGTKTFIRKGGIVKMAGTYHTITDVTGNVVTVSGKIDSNVTSAFFPAAFIVDNTSAEGSTWDSGINTISGDDGDGIVESVKKSGSTWTWDTSIYAGELDDGEVTLVCVAFDVAENSAKSETTFMLTNKTPRLSKLYLATDLNGDGKYSEDELGTSVITASGAKTVEKYYSAMNAGSLQEVFTVYGNTDDQNNSTTDSRITMRDNLGMAFEFVSGYEGYGSGQGDMKYKLSVSQSPIDDAEAGTADELDELVEATANKFVNSGVTSSLVGKKFLELTPGMFKKDDNTVDETYGSYTEMLVDGESDYDDEANYLNYIHITLWDNSNSKAGTKDGTKESHDYTNNNDIDSTYDTYATFGAQWTAFNIPLYMDLVDGLRPVVTINDPVPLSADQGHVDLGASLTGFTGSNELDGDDKISGKVKFSGTINDERRITEIKMTVNKSFSKKAVSGVTLASYRTSTGDFDKTSIVPNSATGLTFKILSSTFSTTTGHTVKWELEVDSEKVGDGDVADKNVKFTLTANDGTGDGTSNHQVDIVPYITKLYTALADSAGEEFARSATGKYVVRANETVRMYGYNLKAGTNAVKVSYASGDPTSLTPENPTAAEITSYGSHLKLPIGTNANSGKVTITVNGVQSLNNLNTNPTFASLTDDTITANGNNSQANGITNNRLTDDVELWVWTMGAFDDVMSSMKTNVNSPIMKMDNSGNYYISYGNGSSYFAIDKNGTSANLEVCYNKYHNTNVAFDSSGNFYGVATNTDRVDTGRNDATSFTFFSRALGKTMESTNSNYPANSDNTYVNGSTTRANYYNGSNKRRLELSQYGGDNGTYNVNRVQRPKMIVTGAGTTANPAEVYMAYYDASADNVKFRYGTVTGTESLNTIDNGRGANPRYTYTRNGKMTGGLENDLTGNEVDTSSADGYHLIANTATTTKFKAGAYTAVGYTTGGSAVVAWYDSKARRIVYSYNDAPGTALQSMTNNTWQTNAVYLDEAYTGWYVDLVVDAGNHVHIAYYNSKSGDLKYVYIPTYNAVAKDADGNLTGGATVVTVDSYLSVGTNITINVRDEGTGTGNAHVAKYVPYIYYYNTSNNQTMNSVKVAWRKDMTTLRDGAISDKFTGAWESMTIPTTNIPVDATVCGGVPTGTHTGGTDYTNTVVLGYMTDSRYEKASIKGSIK